jgi:predicted RNA-binding protein YlxR (DUF448 family)
MPLHEVHDVGVLGRDADKPHSAEAQCGSTRRCIVSGSTLPASSLVRFVVGPGDCVVPDICATLPGRGMWLSADRNTVKTAQAQRHFGRAARRAVNVDDYLVDQVESLLAQRCIDLIGLARRGGQAICGFEKVRGWLEEGGVGCLVIAEESAASGCEKLVFMSADAPVIRALMADEIGRAFGREHSVFAALKTGGLARKFVVDAERLNGFRGTNAAG